MKRSFVLRLFLSVGTSLGFFSVLGFAQVEKWRLVQASTIIYYTDLEDSVMEIIEKSNLANYFVSSATTFKSDKDNSFSFFCDSLIFRGISNDTFVIDKLEYKVDYLIGSKDYNYIVLLDSEKRDTIKYVSGTLAMCKYEEKRNSLRLTTIYIPLSNPILSTSIGGLGTKFRLTVTPFNEIKTNLIQ